MADTNETKAWINAHREAFICNHTNQKSAEHAQQYASASSFEYKNQIEASGTTCQHNNAPIREATERSYLPAKTKEGSRPKQSDQW